MMLMCVLGRTTQGTQGASTIDICGGLDIFSETLVRSP